MKQLTKPLSDHERETIAMELERLFILQDKPFPAPKKIIFVNELSTGVYSFTAVLKGIKELHSQDLRSIKLSLLIEAICKYMDHESNRYNCQSCHKEGCVLLIDTSGASFALACTCSNGDIIAELQGLVRWNGKSIQDSNGRMLFRTHEHRDTDTYDPKIPPEGSTEPVQITSEQELASMVASVGGTIVDLGEKK